MDSAKRKGDVPRALVVSRAPGGTCLSLLCWRAPATKWWYSQDRQAKQIKKNRTPASHWRNWPVSKGAFTSRTTAFKDGEENQIGITMDLLYAIPTYFSWFPDSSACELTYLGAELKA